MRRQLVKQKSGNLIQLILLKARGFRNSLEFIHLLKINQIVDSLGQILLVRLSEGFYINANRVVGNIAKRKSHLSVKGAKIMPCKSPYSL